MKSQLTTLIFLLITTCGFAKNGTINAIIGDHSFISKYGQLPGIETNEKLRIQTHLEFVENLLRNKSTLNLGKTERVKRFQLLDDLHTYWTTGIFPKNTKNKFDRNPCFIDDDGNICAVGYLIERSAGRAAAEEINANHQMDYLLDMDTPIIENWAKENGFSVIELAMIQPTYADVHEEPIIDEPVEIDPFSEDGYVQQRPVVTELPKPEKKYRGPSKKEIALTEQLDSLTTAHNATLMLLDITQEELDYQYHKMETIEAEKEETLSLLEDVQTTSHAKISKYQWFIFGLGMALILAIGALLLKRRKANLALSS